MSTRSVIREMALIACFAMPVASAAQVKKYDLKSGIVTFDTIMSVSGMTIKEKAVVTFDDWGAKEKRDSYQGNEIKDTFLCDGKNQIKLVHGEKAAYIVGQCSGRGTELRFDWSEISDADKKSGKVRQLPPMTVVGKKCQAFEMKQGGSTSKFAGFGKVTLYTEVASGGTKSVSTAVKFEENAAIPANALQIPAGYATKKWP